MYIFLSYSRADLAYAEQIEANLKQAGHEVFFDKHSIKVAEDFNRVIWGEIQKADLFVYLISKNSIRQGSYALTELTLAEKKWPNPERRVLPVLIEPTDLANIPIYASICNILQPEGNVSARVRIEVNELSKIHLRKKLKQLVILLISIALMCWGTFFAYYKYLDQAPVSARTKLGVMNVIYDKKTFVDSAYRGDLNVINLFLKSGMNPNVVNSDGETALMKAVTRQHLKVVNALIKAKTDFTIQNRWGETALSIATAIKGQEEIVIVLINAGAKDFNNAFTSAAKNRNLAVLRLLIDKKIELSTIDNAFLIAAGLGDIEMLSVLENHLSNRQNVATHALLETSYKYRESSGIKITNTKKIDIFNYLLDLGADVNFKDEGKNNNGVTILIKTVLNEEIDLTRLLLQRNADVNEQCICPQLYGGDQTPLMMAIKKTHHDKGENALIEMLIAHGADVNMSKKDGTTPLMLAAELRGKLNIFQLLLDKGAHVNDKTNNNETALSHAVKAGRAEIVLALLKQGAVFQVDNNLLLTAVDYKRYDVVKILLKQNIDINKTDKKGQTALMYAVQNNDADMVRILLVAGVNLSKKDNMGRTAKVFANRLKKNREILELLQHIVN